MWEVYFSVMRCGAVSQRRGKEQKQPIPADPVTLPASTWAGPSPSLSAAGVQQHNRAGMSPVGIPQRYKGVGREKNALM